MRFMVTPLTLGLTHREAVILDKLLSGNDLEPDDEHIADAMQDRLKQSLSVCRKEYKKTITRAAENNPDAAAVDASLQDEE